MHVDPIHSHAKWLRKYTSKTWRAPLAISVNEEMLPDSSDDETRSNQDGISGSENEERTALRLGFRSFPS